METQEFQHHLYINPLEKCNLRCAVCYTKKTNDILSNIQILDFVTRYHASKPLKSITFCGGEVFVLPDFPNLINTLTGKGIFIQIITNGTIDRLNALDNPNNINLIVSIDGQKEYHDANRGVGNFDTSIGLLKKAQALGFHTEVFSIVTKENFDAIDIFEANLFDLLGRVVQVTYHPRKPLAYLQHHPISNVQGKIKGFDFLEKEQMKALFRNRKTFPPKERGCYQISLVSSGDVYACCEGTVPIGRIEDAPEFLIEQLTVRLQHCPACPYPVFACGMKEYFLSLHQLHTSEV